MIMIVVTKIVTIKQNPKNSMQNLKTGLIKFKLLYKLIINKNIAVVAKSV